MPKPAEKPDPPRRDTRVLQTRGAIVGSFNELVFERPYDDINVPDILGEAGVGRSTFYEHFKSKDDVLLHAASEVLAVLADSVVGRADRTALVHKLEHFRLNRRMALDLLSGEIGVRIGRRFAEILQARLEETAAERRLSLGLPSRLVAAQFSGAMIALITEWLASLDPVSSPRLADAIIRTIGAGIERSFAPHPRV